MKSEKLILGIESSCDECSASVVKHHLLNKRLEVLSVATYSQIKLHQPFGGVVPEVASRNHLETINAMIESALSQAHLSASQIDVIAVTNRPGLVGALLVGVSAAKAMAYALNKPLVAVHHLEGHIASVLLEPAALGPLPALIGVVSGGHTLLHVMKDPPGEWPVDFLKNSRVARSLDDAAGEAFDKTAKLLGFPYPGGAWIERGAVGGDPHAFELPRAIKQKDRLDFSFSGLKTAAALLISRLQQEGTLEARKADVCASIQEAIIDMLTRKIELAIKQYQCKSLALVGGVAANQALRSRLANKIKVPVSFPDLKYCTDNAAMIAAAGALRFQQGMALSQQELLTLNAIAYPDT